MSPLCVIFVLVTLLSMCDSGYTQRYGYGYGGYPSYGHNVPGYGYNSYGQGYGDNLHGSDYRHYYGSDYRHNYPEGRLYGQHYRNYYGY
ncbi:keratin-associated protein 19-2-like isoform X2 [Cherax quadricarinatus]|uniref:keratin-associated protein 19-2-like isoform X2 n=1 Tax=Cherax quadricarinatus TaxID=27406 RepID=UPI00387E64F3